MAENKCPPLGVGSVDFNAVHDAAMKNRPLAEAIDKARVRIEVTREPKFEAPAPAPAPAPEPAAKPDADKSAD